MHHVLCAVRSRPVPEIHEVSVPARDASRTKKKLAAEGWETIFVLRSYTPNPDRKANA